MRGHFQTEGMVILLNACVSPHPTRPPHQWKIARRIDYSSAKTGVVLFGDGVGVVEVLLKLYSMIVYFSSIIYYLPRKVTSPQIAIWHALIAEYWLLIAECWLLVADCWLLNWLLIAECCTAECWLLIAGYWPPLQLELKSANNFHVAALTGQVQACLALHQHRCSFVIL